MNRRHFEPARSDGRSNAQVILDLVKHGEPGQIYPYAELLAVLNTDAPKEYTLLDMQRIVGASQARLLKEQDRALSCIRRVGYRLAPAKEHLGLALTHKRRADHQLHRGMTLLRHVRWDELDANARKAHEATLMITESLYLNQLGLEKRLRAVEDAIRGLKG